MKFFSIVSASWVVPLVAAAVDTDGQSHTLSRALQDASDAFSFNFGGAVVTADMVEDLCPGDWQDLINCVIIQCPIFLEVCPESEVPASTGSDELTCLGIERDLCTQYAGEDCCLDVCNEQFRDITVCVYEGTTGASLGYCEGPIDCEALPDPFMNNTNVTLGGEPILGGLPLIGLVDAASNVSFLAALQFGEYGAEEMQFHCPNDWQAWVSCVIATCPTFREVCPGRVGEGEVIASRSFMEGACDALQEDICEFTAGDDCCLSDCMMETQAITTCIHTELSSLDFTYCLDVACAIEEEEEEPARLPLIGLNPSADSDSDVFAADLFQFGEYGLIEMNENCPDEWTGFVTCMVSDCPQFLEVCEVGPGASSVATSRSGVLGATCADLEEDMCKFVAGDDCCLADCIAQAQAMTACLHSSLSGLDLTDCQTATCTGAVPYD